MAKKNIFQILVLVLVAIFFISSYAVIINPYGNNSSASTTTGVVNNTQTVYLSTITNSLISNYTGLATVAITCKNSTMYNSTINNVSKLLGNLEKNGSILNSYQIQNIFYPTLNSFSPENLYSYIYSKDKNESNCITIQATAQLLLPSTINFTYGSGTSKQNVPIKIPSTDRILLANVTFPS